MTGKFALVSGSATPGISLSPVRQYSDVSMASTHAIQSQTSRKHYQPTYHNHNHRSFGFLAQQGSEQWGHQSMKGSQTSISSSSTMQFRTITDSQHDLKKFDSHSVSPLRGKAVTPQNCTEDKTAASKHKQAISENQGQIIKASKRESNDKLLNTMARRKSKQRGRMHEEELQQLTQPSPSVIDKTTNDFLLLNNREHRRFTTTIANQNPKVERFQYLDFTDHHHHHNQKREIQPNHDSRVMEYIPTPSRQLARSSNLHSYSRSTSDICSTMTITSPPPPSIVNPNLYHTPNEKEQENAYSYCHSPKAHSRRISPVKVQSEKSLRQTVDNHCWEQQQQPVLQASPYSILKKGHTQRENTQTAGAVKVVDVRFLLEAVSHSRKVSQRNFESQQAFEIQRLQEGKHFFKGSTGKHTDRTAADTSGKQGFAEIKQEASQSLQRSKATMDNLIVRLNSWSTPVNLSPPRRRSLTPTFKNNETNTSLEASRIGDFHIITSTTILGVNKNQKTNNPEGQSSVSLSTTTQNKKQYTEDYDRSDDDTTKLTNKVQADELRRVSIVTQRTGLNRNLVNDSEGERTKTNDYFDRTTLKEHSKENQKEKKILRESFREKPLRESFRDKLRESQRDKTRDSLDGSKFKRGGDHRWEKSKLSNNGGGEKQYQTIESLGVQAQIIMETLARLLSSMRKLASLPKIYQSRVHKSLFGLWRRFEEFRTRFLDQERLCVNVAASLKVEELFETFTRDKLLLIYGFKQNYDQQRGEKLSLEVLFDDYLRKDLNVFVSIVDEFLLKLQSQQLLRIEESIVNSHNTILNLENKMKYDLTLQSSSSLALRNEYRNIVKPVMDSQTGHYFDVDEKKFYKKEQELGLFSYIQPNSKLMGKIITNIYQTIHDNKTKFTSHKPNQAPKITLDYLKD